MPFGSWYLPDENFSKCKFKQQELNKTCFKLTDMLRETDSGHWLRGAILSTVEKRRHVENPRRL